jgi:hypothetical protein
MEVVTSGSFFSAVLGIIEALQTLRIRLLPYVEAAGAAFYTSSRTNNQGFK